MIHSEKTGSRLLDYIKTYMFFELGFDLAFTEFENYQNLIEGFLDNGKKRLDEELKKLDLEELSKNVDEEVKFDYQMLIVEDYMDEIQEMNEIFPNNFRASFFMLIYSFIESELKHICYYLYQNNESEFKFKTKKGESYIDVYNRYLNEIFKVNISEYIEWNFIDNVRNVRNIIAHQRGIIKPSDSKSKFEDINKFCKRHDFLELKEETQYLINEESKSYEIRIINKNANEELLKKTKSFFKRLLEEEKLKELIS